jgi:hypothetical protein
MPIVVVVGGLYGSGMEVWNSWEDTVEDKFIQIPPEAQDSTYKSIYTGGLTVEISVLIFNPIKGI